MRYIKTKSPSPARQTSLASTPSARQKVMHCTTTTPANTNTIQDNIEKIKQTEIRSQRSQDAIWRGPILAQPNRTSKPSTWPMHLALRVHIDGPGWSLLSSVILHGAMANLLTIKRSVIIFVIFHFFIAVQGTRTLAISFFPTLPNVFITST